MSKDYPEDDLVKTKILGVGGSPRKSGNSDILLKSILKGAEREGVETESVQLRDYDFKPCIGCERCRKDLICTGLNDGMTLLYPKLIESRGLILASPIHWYYVTAMMKAFIDRLYCFFDWPSGRGANWRCRLDNQDRKMVLAVVYEQHSPKGMGTTLESMHQCMEDLCIEVVDEMAVGSTFAVGEIKKNSKALSQAEAIGAKLARQLKK